MTYFFFYWLLKITCHLYFRKIKIYDYENVSPNKPLIICANHGNSFMDAILMAIIFKRKLHFLARADAFNTPFKRWFLGKINMMPVYRIRDGREVLKNNDAIFDRCQQILENNGAILIFPEGNCIVEKRLRTFKAGFVQMAYASTLKNLELLTVSINYSKPFKFNSEVDFYFNAPFNVSKIKYETEGYIAFSKLVLNKVKIQIAEKMIIIPDAEDDEFYDQVLEIVRNNNSDKVLGVAQKLNILKNDNSRHFIDLNLKTSQYFRELNKFNITDKVLIVKIGFWRNNFLFAFYPFYYLGKILNYLPSNFIESKLKKAIKEKQFLSAVRMVIALFVYVIYIPIISLILFFFIGKFIVSLFGVIMILLFYRYNFSNYQLFEEHKSLESLDVNELKSLILSRKEILKAINL